MIVCDNCWWLFVVMAGDGLWWWLVMVCGGGW